ncbi:protease Do-like 10, mitochondrial isoform X2 [Phalaenopsis equestris]|uniref:protease Do-like 10, mitochondrial isoform X2 n=1 Tax=Phalaenopsis equestris TaxID=78828 RepID=UPI0009E531C5|nr:protease Do-like 10, mitochondrial isoform X2 [Phalaenopsis equestris]
MLRSLHSLRRLNAHRTIFSYHLQPFLRESSPLFLPIPLYSFICSAATAVAAPEKASASCSALSRHVLEADDVLVRYQYADAYAAIELALDSVVKVFTVSCSPNYFLPWQNKSQRESTGSGFVIPGQKILTNAHVVADHTFVLVRKHGSPTKYKAEVQAVGHECDLALLTVDSEEFWEGMSFLDLGDIPFLQEAVAVVGYPQGGDNISVTKGVVSRVEPTQYVHGAAQLMAIQIDAAINPGNSGGPAIMGNKVAGVAFQNLSGAENIGYIIPVPIIRHFLSGVEENGRYVGFCSLGLSCQPTENVQLREHFHMHPEMTGVLVSKINPLSDAFNVLEKDDIIIAFDGVPIANDGTVAFRNRERITFDHLVSMKKPDEKAFLRVLRDGVVHELSISLRPVLMDDINTGYERLSELQVKKVNGTEVDNLKHLCSLVEGCHEENLRFDLDDERVIVLNYRNAKLATSRILKRHRIPSAMSGDLIDEIICSKAEVVCSS